MFARFRIWDLDKEDMDWDAYERILDEMQADPRDEPDYYYDMENA
jgi:hypothetical protein